jgi:hypothetical protein
MTLAPFDICEASQTDNLRFTYESTSSAGLGFVLMRSIR